MISLAIDTSTARAGLAVIKEGKLLAEINWEVGRNHSVELLPRLEKLLLELHLAPPDLDGVIVAHGPGSFNGLRVGMSTAKALAFALKIPVVGISTLAAAAFFHRGQSLPIRPMLPAGRTEVTSAVFKAGAGTWRVIFPEYLTTVDAICTETNEPTLFCGELSETVTAVLKERLGPNAVLAESSPGSGRAGCLAMLGEMRLQAENTDHPATLQPLYLRRPHITTPKNRQSGLGGNELPA